MEQSCKVGVVYSHFRRKNLKRRSDSSKVTDERPICKADFSPILPRSSKQALRNPLFAFQLAILTPSILMKLRGQTRSKEHRQKPKFVNPGVQGAFRKDTSPLASRGRPFPLPRRAPTSPSPEKTPPLGRERPALALPPLPPSEAKNDYDWGAGAG